MAIVPRITVPTVAGASLLDVSGGPQATAASFGGIQARQLGALAGAVGTAANVMADLQEQEDANEVLRAETDLKARIAQRQLEFKDRRGQNAWGLTEEATTAWDETYTEINSGLGTARQQQMLEQRTANTRLSFFESMSAHERGQRREALEANAKANMQSTVSFATANANNPDVLAESRADIKRQISFLAQSNGWSPERREAELTAELTNLHTQVIQELAQESPVAATAYFKVAKKEIDGTQHAELDKFLSGARDRVVAQQAGDKAIGLGMSEEEALADARKKHEGKQREEVEREIKSRYKEQRDVELRGQQEAFNEAWEILAREKRFSAISPALIRGMSGQQIAALENEAASQVSGDPSTEFNRYYELVDMAVNNPTGFADVDLRTHFKNLAPVHRERLIALQTGAAGKTPAYLSAATLQQRIGSAHKQIGLVGKLSDSEQAQKGLFEDEVRRRVEAEQEDKGKKLTGAEQQAIIDGFAREVTIDPGLLLNIVTLGFVDDTRRVFEITDDEINTATLSDSDADKRTREDILSFLSQVKGNTEPTQLEIDEVYREHLRRLKGTQ